MKYTKLDPAIVEICRKIKITDYLRSRGVEVLKSGQRERCKCPLGTHRDSDPSCYIRTNPDGSQMFKCFGCGVAGNIITIMAAMEGSKKGYIVKSLASKTGVSLASFDEKAAKIEPLTFELDDLFCDEHELVQEVSEYAVSFMHEHCTPDAVNKVGRLYELIDEMAETGDTEGLYSCYLRLKKLMRFYGEKEKACPPSTETDSTTSTPPA